LEIGFITKDDRYLFGQGTHYEIYKKLGAHVITHNGERGVYFAVWAPKAVNVSVVGDFNGWMGFNHNMEQLEDSGIFELFVPGLGEGALYKYAVTGVDGKTIFKADPYANQAERRPGTASVVADIEGFKWSDGKWIKTANETAGEPKPMSIYEVHIGSWKKNDEPDGGFMNYREIAHELADYVTEMGYTHVELMGIAEHPFDGSWGYQVTGYYAPTSRYGTPKDFMYFVDYLHKKNIGIILDWVPAHFPRDEHGLANFDGTATYEYADPRKGEHPDWGTKIFDYGKNEVKNFLIANALYWVEHYHIDGLRVDAVASMLYLDYGKRDGQWVANEYGGNQNLEAIEFFRHLNDMLLRRNPRAMMVAEESTAWPMVTYPPKDGGLGFSYKWNMGWMNDFLEYVKQDPLFKKFNHNKMTFSLTYAYSENYILVLSHDEVVHLKCSMLEKMPGYFIDKVRGLMTAYTFMFGHPGKKLLFMGQEFGQIREWSEERSLDWYLLNEPEHKGIQDHMKNLLSLYKKYPSLWELDNSWEGFQWINCNDGDRSIFSFVRKSKDRKKNLLFVCNFTPIERGDYAVGVPVRGKYKVVLDTNNVNIADEKIVYTATKSECDGQPYRVDFSLPPLTAVVLEYSEPAKREKKVEAAPEKEEKQVKKTAAKKTTSKTGTKTVKKTATKAEEKPSKKTVKEPVTKKKTTSKK